MHDVCGCVSGRLRLFLGLCGRVLVVIVLRGCFVFIAWIESGGGSGVWYGFVHLAFYVRCSTLLALIVRSTVHLASDLFFTLVHYPNTYKKAVNLFCLLCLVCYLLKYCVQNSTRAKTY